MGFESEEPVDAKQSDRPRAHPETNDRKEDEARLKGTLAALLIEGRSPARAADLLRLFL